MFVNVTESSLLPYGRSWYPMQVGLAVTLRTCMWVVPGLDFDILTGCLAYGLQVSCLVVPANYRIDEME